MILQKISEIIKRNTGVDIQTNKSRRRNVVDAKKIYAIIARKKTPFTTTQIGDFIGVNYSTIIHYSQSFKGLLKSDIDFKSLYEICLIEVDNLSDIDSMLIELKYHYKKYKYYLNKINKLTE